MVFRILSGILAVLWVGFGVAAFFMYSDSGVYRAIVVPLALIGTGFAYAIRGKARLFSRAKDIRSIGEESPESSSKSQS
jgi:hypothetical protein